jgi:hypothetical protein
MEGRRVSFHTPELCRRREHVISVSLFKSGKRLRFVVYLGGSVAEKLGVTAGDYLSIKWGRGHQDDGLLLITKTDDHELGRRVYLNGNAGPGYRIEIPAHTVCGTRPYPATRVTPKWSERDAGYLIGLPFWARERPLPVDEKHGNSAFRSSGRSPALPGV